MRIILSRTDSIGDVVLTLPMAGLIREKYPEAEIIFIGSTYTEPVCKLSIHISRFLNWDSYKKQTTSQQAKALRVLNADWIIHVFPNPSIAKAARRAGIKDRVGTSHRYFHWLNCNRLISFSRRKSDLHEAQLNCKLLEPLKIGIPELNSVKNYYGFIVNQDIQQKVKPLFSASGKSIILHPKSKGSAREWGVDNFNKLIKLLVKNDYKVFITGTAAEAGLMRDLLEENHDMITDLTGKLSLDEFIAFISLSDALVAASTGPLHLAAAMGICAIGIYPPIKPMHPGRWAPLGKNTHVLVKDISCEDCRKDLDCHCIRDIAPIDVLNALEE